MIFVEILFELEYILLAFTPTLWSLVEISSILVETFPSSVEILFEFVTILPELMATFNIFVEILFEFDEMTLVLVLIASEFVYTYVFRVEILALFVPIFI